MGSNTTTTSGAAQSTNKEPWSGVVPDVQLSLGTAQDLYQSGTPVRTQAPLHQDLNAALQQGWQYYTNPNMGITQPWQTALAGAQGGGLEPGMAPALNTLNALGNTGNSELYRPELYGNIAATGNSALYRPDVYNEFVNGGAVNPFLQQLLDTNATRIGNRAASLTAGAGRYGSAGMYDAINRSIAETNNPILMQAYENNQARKMQAAQGLNNIVSAFTQNQLAGARGMNDIVSAYTQNQLQAANAGLQARTAAAQRALQYTGMAPSLYQLGASPYAALMGIGQFEQGRAQNEIDWNNPWLSLSNLNQSMGQVAPLVTGAGAAYSSPTSSTTSTPTPWTQYAGLGLAGLGLLGGSDVRMKKNIELVGQYADGLNRYSWHYNEQPDTAPKNFGPMAQDVAQKYPDAVVSVGGYLHIRA